MAAPAKSVTVSGRITAVDTAANTLVVDVAKGKQMFTGGGPLAPKATMTRGGKAAKLSVFKQGGLDTVGNTSYRKRTYALYRLSQIGPPPLKKPDPSWIRLHQDTLTRLDRSQ